MKKNIIISCFAVLLFYACSDTDYNQGEALYKRQCANCHMDDGSGLQGLIPPLAKADYLNENKNQLACIIRNGLNAPIMVNGKVYNQQVMPGNVKLKDVEITNIANYILSAWGNKGGVVSLPEVKAQLENCK